MNRADLQNLSRLRLRESRALFRAGHYAGAYYLAGYSVECALKACIARRTKRSSFPNKDLALRAYSHVLKDLVQVAELQQALDQELRSNASFLMNWQVVKDWKVESRYNAIVTQAEAHGFIAACDSPSYGVLPWVRKQW